MKKVIFKSAINLMFPIDSPTGEYINQLMPPCPEVTHVGILTANADGTLTVQHLVARIYPNGLTDVRKRIDDKQDVVVDSLVFEDLLELRNIN